MLEMIWKKVLAVVAIVMVVSDLVTVTIIPTIQSIAPAIKKTWDRCVLLWNGQ